MIRDYLKNVTSQQDAEQAAREFADIAIDEAGESVPGYTFKRQELYDRNL